MVELNCLTFQLYNRRLSNRVRGARIFYFYTTTTTSTITTFTKTTTFTLNSQLHCQRCSRLQRFYVSEKIYLYIITRYAIRFVVNFYSAGVVTFEFTDRYNSSVVVGWGVFTSAKNNFYSKSMLLVAM
jgi:hypothetical protein